MADSASHSAQNPRSARAFAFAAAAVLFLGLLVTLALFLHARASEIRRARAAFAAEAQAASDRVLREVQLFVEVLDSIRQLHGISDRVSREAFEEIVLKGMLYQRRILGAYGFAQVLPSADRPDFETTRGAPILEATAPDAYRPADDRPLYCPVTYQMPPLGLDLPDSFDVASSPACLAAVSNMFRHGTFAMAPSPSGTAWLMFAPTLYIADGPAALPSGFARASFSPDRILAAACDPSTGLVPRLVPAAPPLPPPLDFSPDAWTFALPVSIAGADWLFSAASPPRTWLARLPRRSLWILPLGTAASLLLALWLFALARRARDIEALVAVRTAELADANRSLSSLMEEHRRLEDTLLRVGQEERARVGRDLHDSLGQKLTGALYLYCASHPADDTIATTLRDAVSQVRRTARGLAPVELTPDGLPDALRSLADESAALYNLDVDFFHEREAPPLAPSTAEHLFLIAKELVTNAAKHAHPKRIVISLDCPPGGPGHLFVEDDGDGLSASPSPNPDPAGGNGLRILRHRADVLRATVRIDSAPSRGTTVHVFFPLPADAGSPPA